MVSEDAIPPAAPRVRSTIAGLVRLMSIPAVKVLLIGLLLLSMLIPLDYVSGLIKEREARQAEVASEFQRSWGPSQSVLGPVLVVPYWTTPDKPKRYLHLAPGQLKVTARLAPELRKRGLFHSIVYTADVSLSGTFLLSREAAALDPSTVLLWQDALVVLTAADLRALKSSVTLNWNGQTIPWDDCGQTSDAGCGKELYVVARPTLNGPPKGDESIPFETRLELRGTQAFRFAPLGKEVDFTVSAPWSSPSFVGALLPSASKVDGHGFDASWHVSSNLATGRWIWSSPQAFPSEHNWRNAEDQIGVELLEAMPTYHMVDRASKYALLFLALSFLTYFLFETVAGVRIHIIQYGLLGLSIALFALLLISLSEPLAFNAGYVLSSLMILLQASLYTAAVTRSARRAALFAGVLAMLFTFLYVLLSLESYSLVVGSLALFTALSVVMIVTRRLDWSRGRMNGDGEAEPTRLD
jgi:inner membrane protein